ncbi:RsmD family RNA methyltransferase [Sediminivirga luteola]|uniref:Methyltransferase n=1 Tax=Sediminivirga luteola TaxID=1774748 RepID=A0A8J2TV56_9MICO|nr:RsmD family RNA methyltransferase [Sediminivirga luteola]MCI2264598.1 RsmD family RNA methyltransferase [Sediminivirga luteola]GGA03128.1 methyltransferase [Sediminivirga luteola]
MTRIIAGVHGGLRLRTPRGEGTRPTSDRVREALFSALESLHAIEGQHVLDLFAGSGALGLEAVSRGASSAVLVDPARPALTALRANAAAVAGDRVVVAGQTAQSYLQRASQPGQPAALRRPGQPGRPLQSGPSSQLGEDGRIPQSGEATRPMQSGKSNGFGLVFIDPPYDLSEQALSEVLTALLPLLSDEAVVVVERSARSPQPEAPTGLETFRRKTYGETALYYLEPVPPDADG